MNSPLAEQRLHYQPRIPSLLADLEKIHCIQGALKQRLSLQALFPKTWNGPSYEVELGARRGSQPLKVGAFFSGGPAPGGHNVLTGLFDALQQMDTRSELIGFLGGPAGVLAGHGKRLHQKEIDSVRNQGGFDLLGTDRTKIETAEQLTACLRTVQAHQLDALIIIGGDDSNTNGALLAEFFLREGQPTSILGVPKTIDGDLRSPEVEISFGFHTACKTYAELIGNIARDALSAKKYYHFIKLMGRSASHVTLECALATQPNLALIGEERKTLSEIVKEITDLIVQRYKIGKEYGVILIPEGLLEFVSEFSLPLSVKEALEKRDPHGNISISQVATETLLIQLVEEELKLRKFTAPWRAQSHFLGYEGRSALPTNFDANYAYALGRLAAVGAREKITGALVSLSSLQKTADQWSGSFVPLVDLLHFEKRNGVEKPVIAKTLVSLQSAPYLQFKEKRGAWALEDRYLQPGPIQFFGEVKMTDGGPISI